jgi:hypothetical protein
MKALLDEWHMKPVVLALMGFKGYQTVAAMITVSEIGDIHRFPHPRQLMAYLGLVPSESSSGGSRAQGTITKCGNGHLRWIFNECAQHYRLKEDGRWKIEKRARHLNHLLPTRFNHRTDSAPAAGSPWCSSPASCLGGNVEPCGSPCKTAPRPVCPKEHHPHEPTAPSAHTASS